jgi:citrate lyase subunit beta/citryl-CoA lyase
VRRALRLRSVHFVPGGQRKLLDRALATNADALVLDLEDATAPERKSKARALTAEWLGSVDFGRKIRIVRINALDGALAADDIEACLPSPPELLMIPKVRGADELVELDSTLDALEEKFGHGRGAIGLLPLATETPEGLLQIAEIAAAPRIAGIAWGAEDLSAALGSRGNRGADGSYLEIYRHARWQTLLAARAAGVQAIDGVFTDYKNDAGLRAETDEAARAGFDGKMTIHPAQIDPVNAAFTPSAEELARAQRLLAAFETELAAGRSVFSFEGQMVDAPHRAQARRILQQAGEPRGSR